MIDYLTHKVNQWKHMRHLQLGSVFGGNLLTQIPDTIVEMPSLEELDLSFNQLCVLPSNMYIPSLLHLNVSRNKLDSLPTSIGRCHGLKTLNVSKNHLTTLPANLVELDNLELLDISENLLCIMPADILERMKTTLLISGNPLTRPGHCDLSNSSDAYAQVLKRMTMRALPMMPSSSASSSSSTTSSKSVSVPTITLRDDHHNNNNNDNDDDASIDRELSFLAQQLNVQGARYPLTATLSRSGSPLSENPATTDDTMMENSGGLACTLYDHSTNSETSVNTNIVHSLRELATRVILQSKKKVPLHMIPPHLANDLAKHNRRWCAKCQQPFVNEWLTSVQVKSYSGHPAVVRRVRFCSTRCWQQYLHSRKSVVCVHRAESQPILRQSAEQEESDWLQASSLVTDSLC
ncbi:uncharacterized protein BX664DRAFT_303808 [Halteromyces radiatus]|uniref:uncharacterized protein n=1 Tax=Halteromyces radiatus TaxID=101107 RepID=UPI0022202B36|nr:uncharacterized protein BX664DRAFT_303808 [Halteromyces radiatus]KAI8077681.1 hypothetical protein BX664DRAFT_303808 [Halteromyces radiatus]